MFSGSVGSVCVSVVFGGVVGVSVVSVMLGA